MNGGDVRYLFGGLVVYITSSNRGLSRAALRYGMSAVEMSLRVRARVLIEWLEVDFGEKE